VTAASEYLLLEDTMAIRIVCINKAAGQHENLYVAISHLGWQEYGTAAAGKWTRERLYDWIEYERGEAFVESVGSKVRVMTAVTARGTKYVKTQPNNTENDNLLRLPEC
jgi:hypothetical protein